MSKQTEKAVSIKIRHADYLRIKEKMANSGMQMQFIIGLALDALFGAKKKGRSK